MAALYPPVSAGQPTPVASISAATTAAHVFTEEGSLVVAFPGTGHLGPAEPAVSLGTHLRQWLRNADFRQVEVLGHRVHRGYWAELEAIYPTLLACIGDHGGRRGRLLLAGHSAGAATATLLARRLEQDGVAVDAVYAFSSPRVADGSFRQALTTPVYRFECRDDPIPHVAPSPAVLGIVDKLLGPYADALDEYFPFLLSRARMRELTDTEYIHAGDLYFLDWEDDWLTASRGFGDYFTRLFSDINAAPMPASLLNTGRFTTTLLNLGAAALEANPKIALDHCIRRAWGNSWSTLFQV